MPLTAASTLTRRARYSTAGSLRSLGPLGSAAAVHHHQQTRGFRFGRLWSSLDPEFHRDICRRSASRYKYTDSLNQRSPWDKHSLAEDVKRVVNNYWHPHCKGRQAGGRYVNTHASPKTPDNPEGIRPGQNIEDVERAPLEHLLFGGKKSQRAKKKARAAAAAQGTAASTSSKADADVGYVVDPITNRKVFKRIVDKTYARSDEGVDPIRKPYKSQFTPFKAPEVEDAQNPIFYDGPPPEAELKMYGQLKIDANPWDSAIQSTGQESATARGIRPAAGHDGLHGSGLLNTLSSEHKDVFWHHHDGISSSSGVSTAVSWTSRPRASDYPDLHKYRTAIKSDEPTSDEPAQQDYKDLPKYTAVRYQEPDGKPPGQELTEKYEDLDKYDAVRSHEPDGKYKAEPEVEPQELSKYVAFRSHEPDGKYAANHVESNSDAAVKESAPKYEDLDKYGPVRSHEPDGKYKLEPEPPVDPQELSKYGAFRSHEPDGKYAASYLEQPDAAELAEYSKPFFSHEPDGKYAAAYVKPKYDEAELAQYQAFRSHEPDGKYAASYVEPKRDEAELASYGPVRSHEPDGKYAASHVEPKRDEAELAGYGPVRSHEPDGKYAAAYVEPMPDSAELGTYKPFRSHEPDGKYAANHINPTMDAAERGQYQAFRSHEPDGKYAADNTTPTLDATESRQYQAFRSHEPDGKYAAEAASATEAPDLGNHEAFSYEDAETRPPPEATQPSKDAPDLEGYRKVQIDDLHASSAPALSQAYDPVELGKYQPLRWNEPDGKPGDVAVDRTLFEYDLKAETSEAKAQEKTPYRKTVEELMAQPMEESEQPKPEAAAADGVNAKTQPAAASQATSNPTVPSLYKVLVYDPTMQCVEVAETTSIVPDSAAPLTPAEVLLRISNPAKFFPHFAPLQAQGFEIVSGSGDVLIFRKVREATPVAESESVSPKSPEAVAATPSVNPIDMTGGRRDYTVAAGRFASPTGFVNYDLPPPSEAPRVVRAESAVHTEEPAVRGQRVESDKPAKRGVTKRVAVGAAWLAGVSYSLGVVSEYFKTGGADGKGPKGF